MLAHERAHLAGRHPQVMMVLRALAGSLPGYRCSGRPPRRSAHCWRCAPTTQPSGATAVSPFSVVSSALRVRHEHRAERSARLTLRFSSGLDAWRTRRRPGRFMSSASHRV